MIRVRDKVPSIALRTVDGEATTLSDQVGRRPILVLAMRYYGCLPCRQYLVELNARRAELEATGTDLVVVGVAADFQARHLVDRYGITAPMLLDPEQNLYRALEIPNLRMLDFLRPATYRIYLPMFWRKYVMRVLDGPGQGRVVGDVTQLPGLALIDADGHLRWIHRGQALGDYPPVDDVIEIISDANTVGQRATSG